MKLWVHTLFPHSLNTAVVTKLQTKNQYYLVMKFSLFPNSAKSIKVSVAHTKTKIIPLFALYFMSLFSQKMFENLC